jgi:hypothetical protein
MTKLEKELEIKLHEHKLVSNGRKNGKVKSQRLIYLNGYIQALRFSLAYVQDEKP